MFLGPLFDLIKQKQTTATVSVIHYMFPECHCHFEYRAAFVFVCLLVFLSLSFVYELISLFVLFPGINYEITVLKPVHL